MARRSRILAGDPNGETASPTCARFATTTPSNGARRTV